MGGGPVADGAVGENQPWDNLSSHLLGCVLFSAGLGHDLMDDIVRDSGAAHGCVYVVIVCGQY